jgi:hypothetical protein
LRPSALARWRGGIGVTDLQVEVSMVIKPAAPPPVAVPPGIRVVLRWILIWATTALAFHASLVGLYREITGGGLVGYVFALPWLALLAMQGIARRRAGELPIHDRQTDLIFGSMGLVLAVLLQGVLVPRYLLEYELLRIDLLAMWVFVVSAAVMLFGLRPVARFTGVWVMLLAVFPLPYHIMVVSLGGGRGAAGAVMLPLAALATALAVGRTRRRGLLGAALAAAVGGALIGAIAVIDPGAALWVYQLVPPLVATALVGTALFFARRRGDTSITFSRTIAPVSAKDVWLAAIIVIAAAIVLSLLHVPRLGVEQFNHDKTTTFDRPLIIPPNWSTASTSEYLWIQRLFGPHSTMYRQQIIQQTGDQQWDKFGRPRTVVVDSVTTSRPNSFAVYPNDVLYDLSATRISDARLVDLGHGVTGSLYTVVDDGLLVTWTAVSWTWANGEEAQRVTLLAVDNHDENAVFPQPAESLVSNLNTLFTILLRGNAAVDDANPAFKDVGLLTDLGQQLVADQLAPGGRGTG